MISEVNVKVTKTSGQKKNPLPEELKLTKSEVAKIMKAMPEIRERLNDAAKSQTESEDEVSQLSKEEEEIYEEEKPKTARRKIVKIVGIREQPKRNASKAKQAPQERIDSKVPPIGKRRKRMEEADDFLDNDIAKKQRISSEEVVEVKQKKAPKPKKAPAKPAVFKLGKWNPDIEIIESEETKTSDSNELQYGCCTRCTNRNVHRAVLTGNLELLKKCIYDKKRVTNLNAYWSADLKVTPLQMMVEGQRHEMLEAMIKPKLTVPRHSDFHQTRHALIDLERERDDAYLMAFVDTGRVGKMAYGVNVRAVEMSRGGR